ncbi:hypothetical protein [Amylibacter marinus]|uniref:hypothetical protein n=1 Tax=Amylibacter marinus TaxID=1475483 RepID=UPI0024E11E44|nr:hypothetical protein [Amylibacter marinus]
MAQNLPPYRRILLTGLIILTAFFFLNWRRFAFGLPLGPILMSGLTFAIVPTGVAFADRSDKDSFLWPAGLFVTLLSTGLVGLLSGYLGLAQLGIAHAALLGGLLLIPFLGLVFGSRKPIFKIPTDTAWIFLTNFGVLGVMLASFATNLHPAAYCLLLITLISPLGAAYLLPMRPALLTTLVSCAISAIPATGAILIAFSHF